MIFQRFLVLLPSILIATAAAQAADQPPEIVQVASGFQHAVALRSDGTVINWGVTGIAPDQGPRGSMDGAVLVPNLTDIVQVSTIAGAGVALRVDGSVWQWGILDPPSVKVNAPEQVSGLAEITSLSSGSGNRGFAVKSDGTVWEWAGRASPKQLPGFSQIDRISFGGSALLALRNDGTVWQQGPLDLQPSQVNSLSGIVAVSAFLGVAAAVDSAGNLWAWGDLAGFPSGVSEPTKVSGLSGVTRVSGNVAVLADGSVWLWNSRLVADTGTATISSPIRLDGFTEVTDIEADNSLFALDRDNSLRVLGLDRVGETAATVPPLQTRPWRIGGLRSAGVVTNSPFATLAVLRDGTVWGWGQNNNGQLGDGTSISRIDPAPVIGLPGVKQASLGGSHALALASDGTVWSWGDPLNGVLGDGSTDLRLVPAMVPGLAGVVSIAAGSGFNLVLLQDGTVMAWGLGGAVGDGTTTQRKLPVPVPGLDGVVDIKAESGSLALKRNGSVWQWGRSGLSPTLVPGLPRIKAIAQGTTVSLALDDAGEVWAWGAAVPDFFGAGQPLGPTPTRVSTPAEVVKMEASGHILIATKDGAVWALGVNQWGQLGDGTYVDSPAWVRVEGLADVVGFSTSQDGSVAVKADGSVYAWGRDNDGQVGVAEARFYETPEPAAQYRSDTAISMLTPSVGAVGSPVLVSFDVSSWAGTPGGKIRIADGNSFCVETFPMGSCELIPSGTGHRSISATYLGDGTYAQSYALADYFVAPAAANALPGLGVFINGFWFLDRNGDFSFDAPTEMISFGMPGDTPVRGDWNGDGFDEVGVYVSGVWSIDLNGNGVVDAATETFSWGLPGWTPVPGDWNGDGKLDLGAVSPNLIWRRDLNGDFAFDPATEETNWGSPGDTPVVADWNGDGIGDLAVYSGGLWFFDRNGDGAFDFANEAKGWGVAGWAPLPGDWNGDGAVELGVVAPGSVWFRDLNGDFGFDPAKEVLGWGSTGDTPLVGDWNGDGVDEVGVYSGGRWYLDRNGDGVFDPATEFDGWGEPGWTPAPGVWQ